MSGSARRIALMGAQRLRPRVREIAARLGAEGPYAVITAGWQDRERQDEELRAHLGAEAVNLALNERAERAMADDPDLAAAHRARQELLRHLQDVYRIRIHHAFAAELDVRTYIAPDALRHEVDAASIAGIRRLDEDHLAQCTRLREEFERVWQPAQRSAVRREVDELAKAIAGCKTVCIAGGHVAVLRNRMDLFGLPELIQDRSVIAWSAGAMVLTERIVLFHDDAPQGGVLREVLDYGFGLVPGVVVFPEPERRLDITDRERMRLMAQRFAPARGVLFDGFSHVIRDGDDVRIKEALVIDDDGVARPFDGAAS